ncbi:IclR family transcriptional regulator [Paenibacillus hemerocallicola]|jgi:DNA-binding IclR family transcriptional regulator|nr:IclR family transcriptional regulator [Paenibacillus hemerocallicola]
MSKENKENKENKPYYIVQSVERAISIIGLFVRERKPLSIGEVAQGVNLHKSVVHRLLTTMHAHHLLEYLPGIGKYQVGPLAFEFGSIYMNNSLITEGKRFLPELAKEVGEKAHLAILHQGNVLYLVNQESPKSMRMQAPVGFRNHVSSTALGKVLLAWLDEESVVDILQTKGMGAHTSNSITTVDAFLEELKNVRRLGYAVDNEEMELGRRCVAVPVRDHTGEVAAAISVGGRSIVPEKFEETAELVRSYAEAISERLGYVPRPRL